MQRPKVNIGRIIFNCTLHAYKINCIDCRCTKDECIENLISMLEEAKGEEDEI